MKFSTIAVPFGAVLVATVASVPIRRAVDPSLVPEFGVQAGASPSGTGDCKGTNNVNIPCFCPPPRQDFLNSLNANVAAGHAVNNPGVAVQFPTERTAQAAVIRIQASLVTLQNLRGPGQGCPAAATTFSAQLAAAIAGQNPAPAAAAAPPPPPPAAPAPPPAAPAGGDDVARLAPNLGFTAGRNPTGTGDCDGAINTPAGTPIKIPCACPPSQGDFINALRANVQAGHAINNPGLPFRFPTGDSRDDKLARIDASLVTLQNLNGPGKGCPASATTLVAQRNGL